MFLLFQMAEKENDWSDTEIDQIFNISANPQNEESEWDTEDLEPLMKITTFKHYLRLNLLRKRTERHKDIRIDQARSYKVLIKKQPKQDFQNKRQKRGKTSVIRQTERENRMPGEK